MFWQCGAILLALTASHANISRNIVKFGLRKSASWAVGKAGLPSDVAEQLTNLVFDSVENPQISEGQTEYDFVLDIDSVTGVQQGWPLEVYSYDAYEYLAGVNPTNVSSTIVVGLLGYYSKGKSFVLNLLYNAAFMISDKGSWLYPNPDWDRRRCVGVGDGVTTRGISGVFVGYEADSSSTTTTIKTAKSTTTKTSLQRLAESHVLLLDTAGRNAPALIDQPSTLAEGERKINEIRSRERLIDDIMVKITDVMIYVVDEILTDDQRTVFHLIDQAVQSRKSQQIVIVHNWKRVDCRDSKKVASHILGQVVGPFAALKLKRAPADISNYGEQSNLWVSTWDSGSSQFQVTHAIIFDNAVCANRNFDMARKLYDLVTHHKAADNRKAPLVDLIGSAAFQALYSYVKEVEISTSSESGIKMGTSKYQESRLSHAKLYLDLGPTTVLEHLPWLLREMPAAQSAGQITPISHSFILGGVFNLRVDLSGMSYESWMEVPPSPPEASSWFQISFGNAPSQMLPAPLVIKGYRRQRLPGDNGKNAAGHFQLTFEVDALFNAPPKTQFEDGTLLIEIGQLERNHMFKRPPKQQL